MALSSLRPPLTRLLRPLGGGAATGAKRFLSTTARRPQSEDKSRYDDVKLDNADYAVGLMAITAAAGFGWLVYSNARRRDASAVVEPLLDSKKGVPVTRTPDQLIKLPKRQPMPANTRFSVKPGRPLPEKVPYLLVGAGTASFAALRAIRSREPNAKVLILGQENVAPYMRPPLSKEFWFEDPSKSAESYTFKQWNGKLRSAFFEPDEYYVPYEDLMDRPNGGVSLVTGVTVSRIDSEARKVYLDDGTEIGYSKCLLAPGGAPKTLPVFEESSKKDPEIKNRWMVFRSLDDFQHLFEVMKHVRSVAVIGGGFLGSELACALGKVGNNLGVNVCQVFKEEGNLRGVLPEYLSDWATKKVEDCGVCVVPKAEIVDVNLSKDDGGLLLKLSNGSELPADFVVTCVGLRPNMELGRTSRLEVDDQFGGFIVNSEFAARTNLWVAGDASCFFDPLLGRRRVEHHDHAVVSGRLAGENMTGAAKNYKHQSMIWSDLGPEVGFEAVGLVDSRLPTVGVFARQEDPGILKARLNTNMRSEAEEGVAVTKRLDKKTKVSNKVNVPPNPSLGWPGQPMSLNPVFDASASTEQSPSSSDHPKAKPEYKKGVVFYTKDDRVVGIVLWNIFSRMPLARRVLQEAISCDEIMEVAKLFDVHDKDQSHLEA